MALTAAQPANASRFPIYAAIALLLFAFGATIFGQSTEIGTLRTVPAQPVNIRDIVFFVAKDDYVNVTDAQSGEQLAAYAPTEGGFVRGSLQGLGRERKIHNVPETTPYRLILWDNNQLTLSDTGTGLRVDLLAFGPTNAGAFAKFLDRGKKEQ